MKTKLDSLDIKAQKILLKSIIYRDVKGQITHLKPKADSYLGLSAQIPYSCNIIKTKGKGKGKGRDFGNVSSC